jgi:hypothetical protein
MINNLLNDKFSLILLLTIFGGIIYYLTKVKKNSNNKVIETADSVSSELSTMSNNIDKFAKNYSKHNIISPAESPDESHIDEPVHGFKGNDMEDDKVAPLNQAFLRPMSAVCTPDKIDFSKNTVKKYDAKDYLPKEINDEWFATDFQHAKQKVMDDSLINANRYVIGVNTVGSSHKNASWDLRGENPNPKYGVGPWMNSTYEPDLNIKPWA